MGASVPLAPTFDLDIISVRKLGYVAASCVEKRLKLLIFRVAHVVALLLIWLVRVTPASAAAKKIIFDTDPGTDDALALMLALNSPELEMNRTSGRSFPILYFRRR